jgi:hypothetical protein
LGVISGGSGDRGGGGGQRNGAALRKRAVVASNHAHSVDDGETGNQHQLHVQPSVLE